MIWRLFLAIILALLPFTLSAAELDQPIIGEDDVLRGRFTEERRLEGFNGPLRSEGHFVVAPGHGVIWNAEKPFVTTTVITPAGLAQLIDGTRVMQLSAQKIPFMLHLYDTLGGALAGNWQALETDFVITRHGDASNWDIALVPRMADNPAMPFSSITVKGHRFVEKVEMIRTDGGSDIINFLDEKVTHAPPTDAEKHIFVTISQ